MIVEEGKTVVAVTGVISGTAVTEVKGGIFDSKAAAVEVTKESDAGGLTRTEVILSDDVTKVSEVTADITDEADEVTRLAIEERGVSLDTTVTGTRAKQGCTKDCLTIHRDIFALIT